ncbi:MAG: radical SAM protein [Candidatus Omnitrophica bacterium]|nr:radical SAM protein [Candidatus Omnitrophota bacterium]MDD5237466.1 radical SAM protein [Candidatus Omnitrophota bacterium]
MKIGLIHVFYTYDKEKNMRPFPFGIGYIASYIMQKGHRVEILDLNTTYLKKQEIIPALKKMNCDIFGISSLSGGYTYTKNLIDIIKQYLGTPVIVGGPLATHSAEIVLKNTKADICVIGLGEETTYGIMENLQDLKDVPGIFYKTKTGQIIKNEPAPLASLDKLPWPAYEIMSMEDYIWCGASPDMDSKRKFKKGMRIGQMITGRGCPMGCNFCSKVMGRHFMLRSIDNLIEEIKYLIKTHKINGISFRDELYLVDKKRAYELASRLKSLNIIWMGQARVDKVDYELVKHMKKCGCTSLGFGIESGSLKMLKLMNKGQTKEQIERAVKICQKLDMDMKVQLIMGYPGENRETISETVGLFKRLGHPGRRFHLVTPLPGSTLYEDVISKGIIKDEEQYLHALSRRDSGFSKGLPLVNLTQFSDQELYKLKLDTESKMQQNYQAYLYKHPLIMIKYLRDKLLYHIDGRQLLFNPFLIIHKLAKKIGLLNDKQRENIEQPQEQKSSLKIEYFDIS